MDPRKLQDLLDRVASGGLAPAEAFDQLRDLPFEDLDFAKIDHHRPLRKGYPETIYCAGKTPEQVVEIAAHMKVHGNVLGTGCSEACLEAVRAAHPEAHINDLARAFTITTHPPEPYDGLVAVVCAGTSDLPVAEEACMTLEIMGHPVDRITDVGVAGIHRLFEQVDRLQKAQVVIVCAGMEGALPSVLSGLVSCPVIGVPTSVGYGTSAGGFSALLTMLSSCASGLTVVNIDNGFGAACAAHAINVVAAGKDS